MSRADDFWRRIQRRADGESAEVRRAWLAGVAALRARVSGRELEALIAAGSTQQVIDLVFSDANIDAAFSRFRASQQMVTRDAVAYFGKDIPGVARATVGVAFDVLNPRVLDAVRKLDTTMMQTVKSDVREIVRAAITKGLEDGVGPRTTARALREVLGLAPNQLDAISNYERSLRGIDGAGNPLTRALRDKRYDAMVKRGLAAQKAEVKAGTVWFHGTPADILKSKQGWFVASAGETGVPVVWGSNSIFTAEGYSRGELNLTAPDKFGKYGLSKSYYADTEAVGGVYSLRSKAGTRIFTFDAEGKQWFNISQKSVIQAAKAKGYDAVIFKNVADNYSAGSGMTSDVIAWLDPKSIELAPEIVSKGLTEAQITKMTDAYRRRMIAFNAETNARTATLDALKLGQELSWRDAMDKGIIPEGYVLMKQWKGVMDDREREEHIAMEGETVPFDQAYSNGETVPGESTYNCRCISIVFTAKGA